MIIVVGKTTSKDMVKLVKEYIDTSKTLPSIAPDKVEVIFSQLKDLKRKIQDHIATLTDRQIVGSKTYDEIREKLINEYPGALCNILTKDESNKLINDLEEMLGKDNEFVNKLKKVYSKATEDEWILIWNQED